MCDDALENEALRILEDAINRMATTLEGDRSWTSPTLLFCDEASLRSEGCEDPLAVPTASVRRIDVVAGRAHGKSCKHLIDKHRFVLIQFPPPGAPELSSLERQGIKIARQGAGRVFALEPNVTPLHPAGFVPQFKARALADQHRVAMEAREFAQFGG